MEDAITVGYESMYSFSPTMELRWLRMKAETPGTFYDILQQKFLKKSFEQGCLISVTDEWKEIQVVINEPVEVEAEIKEIGQIPTNEPI